MKNNKLYLFFSRWQAEIAVITSITMILGFMCGRAILSISMFLFCVNALWNAPVREWLKQKWWLLGLGWTGIYLVSYFWSTDIPYWEERVQVKLPYLLFPLAFGLLKPLTTRQLKLLTIGLVALVAGGCLYSLSFYFRNTEEAVKGYSFAKVITTPAYKDHIRYSIFVAWTILWCSFVFPLFTAKWTKILLAAAMLFFTAYLHILAVKSGLLVLYSFIIIYTIYLLLRKKFLLVAVLLLGSGSIGLTAYHTMPSFHTKFYYILYTIREYQSGNETADFSDIGRIISYKLAARIIAENPVIGVGAGDIRMEMKKKYEQFSPNTRPEQRIVPHNQLMEVMMAGGILTLLLFLAWVLYPLRKVRRTRNGFYLLSIWIALFISMLVEPMLEVQFGVFVYLFCLLWIDKATEEPTPEVRSVLNPYPR